MPVCFYMLKSFILYLFFIVVSIFLMPAKAVELKDLYQASIATDSQNSRDRTVALKKALTVVMVKVGGKKSILENDVFKKALKNHQQYLTQYRYQYRVQDNIELVDSTVEAKNHLNEKQLFLLASFNKEKINHLFQQANLSLWGSLRPQVLLWLIDEQGFSRTIVSNSTGSILPTVVNKFSAHRGLPIIMPLMDLTDASQVSISDIWGRFEQPIRAASSRYFAEAIVVMRISNSSLHIAKNTTDKNNASDRNISERSITESENTESENCGLLCIKQKEKKQNYVLDWSLITTKQIFSQQYEGSERQILLQQGLEDITEVIYQSYALSTTSNNDFTMEVANIDSLSTYMQVFNFLDNLSAVKTVTLLAAKGESRRFQLQLLGSVDALLASLKLNKQLQQYVDPLAKMNNNTDVELTPVFYWSAK